MNRKFTFIYDVQPKNIWGKISLLFGGLLLAGTFTAHAQTYCQPALDCTDDDLILNVSISTLTNASTCGAGGYNNFTALPAPVLTAGNSYPIAVTVGDGWATEAVSEWIDYNNNFTFETTEFTFIGVGSGSVVNGSIAIPASATAGNKRMRVRVAAVGAASATADQACDEDDEYGETEDYTVNIQPLASLKDVLANQVKIYKSDNVFVIESTDKLITGAQVYDLSGKLVYNNQNLSVSSLNIQSGEFNNQVLLLKVTTDDGAVTNKKIIN